MPRNRPATPTAVELTQRRKRTDAQERLVQGVPRAASLVVLIGVAYAAAPKTYQVTGPVLSVTNDTIVVHEGHRQVGSLAAMRRQGHRRSEGRRKSRSSTA